MSVINRRLRSLLIALAVLAISATVAFAARPSQVPSPQPNHAAASGEPDESEAPEASEAVESEAPEASDAPDAPEASDANTGDSATGEHPDNHGKLVSEAAKGPTPAGFDNHGAYVRTVAQNNAGHAAAALKHGTTKGH